MDEDNEASKVPNDYKYFGVIRKDSTAGKAFAEADEAAFVFGRAALILFLVYSPMLITSCQGDRDLEEYVEAADVED